MAKQQSSELPTFLDNWAIDQLVCPKIPKWYPSFHDSNFNPLKLSFYPLVMTNIAIENGPFYSRFSQKKLWFSIAMLVITRGSGSIFSDHNCEAEVFFRETGGVVGNPSALRLKWMDAFQCQPEPKRSTPHSGWPGMHRGANGTTI